MTTKKNRRNTKTGRFEKPVKPAIPKIVVNEYLSKLRNFKKKRAAKKS